MSEYVTDPEILRQLQGSSEPAESEYVTDPAILQQLSGEATQPQVSSTEAALKAVAPTVTGVGLQPTGISPAAIGEVLEPMKNAIPQTLKTYWNNPTKALVDVGAAHLGVPPPYASTEGAKSLYNAYKGAQASMDVLGKKVSGPDWSAYEAGKGPFPEAVSEFRNLRTVAQKVDPAFAAQLKTALDTGGDRAVKKLLESAPEALKASPEFAAQASRFTSAMPSTLQQVGRIAGPIARGAARVAGPVGMGMSLYDAGQMARETQLGERLAAGQGRRAEQAFRGGMGMTYQGPQLSPQEAQNMLQSGSARDIQYFGGRDRLQELIRKKAAEKVLGPVAPGSF